MAVQIKSSIQAAGHSTTGARDPRHGFFHHTFVPALISFALIFLFGCDNSGSRDAGANPPAAGFNLAGSDDRAIAIADEVMQALGGRAAWDNTRFITWRFFGRRQHIWDKQSGDLRYTFRNLLVLMNLNTGKGRAWIAGREITDPDSLRSILQKTKSAWINDSYWMFMPYKLKDSGVTLRYLGQDTTASGEPADILELTFAEVGDTPENKYHVYVGLKDRLVKQWDFYLNRDDEKPRFAIPWKNWKKYGDILLSDDRGERKHSDIAVFSSLPEKVFRSPKPIDVMIYAQGEK